jgi:hypothetical protein
MQIAQVLRAGRQGVNAVAAVKEKSNYLMFFGTSDFFVLHDSEWVFV